MQQCDIAGIWKTYKSRGVVAGDEATELDMVQVMEHGSLRSHEYILHFESYGELLMKINPRNITINFVLKIITSEAVWMTEEEGGRTSYFRTPSSINDEGIGNRREGCTSG